MLCTVGISGLQAQSGSSTLFWPSLEDASINVFVDKPTYYIGDTIYLSIQLIDSTIVVNVIPILTFQGTTFKATDTNTFTAVIPQTVTPGSYRVHVKVQNTHGQRFYYETSCFVNVEEHQAFEMLSRYVRMKPGAGGNNPRSAITLDRRQIENLQVIFERDSIRENMGPQFVTIRTSVQSREGIVTHTFERRVLTFRSWGDLNRDRIMFTQYRTAYGTYAAIRPEEFEKVLLKFDYLPNWALIKVNIQPDYTIKIGENDRFNAVTHYYRVKGPRIETKFVLAIPKVLYDTRSDDSLNYGKISAMVRFHYVKELSGLRYPVSLGVGTFGVSSPIDISAGRGGFAASIFLDVVELIRIFGGTPNIKITAGLEIAPFFSIKRKSRILLNTQIGVAI